MVNTASGPVLKKTVFKVSDFDADVLEAPGSKQSSKRAASRERDGRSKSSSKQSVRE